MAKEIYIYLNDSDLSLISNLLCEYNLVVRNKDKVSVDTMQAISSNIETFYIGDDDCYIKFSPCFYTLNLLQPATFRIENYDNSTLNTVFKKIKNHITKVYSLSKDKSFYIGPSIYKDWLNKKYRFSTLLDYDFFTIEEKSINDVFDYILNSAYSIKPNNTRLRNTDILDCSLDSFVVFKNESNLKTTIIRKTMIRYEYDSECIFVYKNNKLNGYQFVLDKRIADASSSMLQLFQNLREKFGLM